MRVLVTGAAGLLGANLVLAATARGLSVTAALHRVRAEFEGAEHVSLDLADPGATGSTVRRSRPDWIIHCAAVTNLDWCEHHPDEAARIHVEATRTLATAAEAAGCAFLYVSTDSVFDGTRGNYAEEDTPNPLNVYARTKLEGEQAAGKASSRCLVARINLFGWNLQGKQSLGEWVLGRLESGEPVPGFEDVHFNPLLASDLADILLDLAAAGTTGLIHGGGGERCSKYHFAQAVAAAFGRDPASVIRSSIASAGFSAPRPLDTSMSVAKLARILSRPLPGIQSSLDRFRQTRENGYLARLKSCNRP